MANSEARKRRFEINKAECIAFANKHGLIVQELNNGYQLRLDGVLDVYPVNKRWHYLRTGDRGGYDKIEELDIAIFATPFGPLKTIESEPQDMTLRNSPIKLKPGVRWDLPRTSESAAYIHPDTQTLIDMIEGNDKHRRDTWPWYKKLIHKLKDLRRK